MKFDVVRDDSDLVQQVIKNDHYLHRYPDPRSLPFAYRLVQPWLDGNPYRDYAGDGRPWGIVLFKKPQHMRQRGLFGYPGQPTHWQVLDLTRVWVHPALQRKHFFNGNKHALCIFSQMVSLAIRRVQWDWLRHHPPVYPDLPYHIRIIISYCDLSHHDGTAYRASGFAWAGYTSDRSKELYVRHLREPLKSWRPEMALAPVQLPLLDGMPLIHGKVS